MDNEKYKKEVLDAFKATLTGEKKFLKRYMFYPEYFDKTLRIIADYIIYDMIKITPQEAFDAISPDYLEYGISNILDKVPVKTEYYYNRSKNFIYYVYKDILEIDEEKEKIKFYEEILNSPEKRFPKKCFLQENGKEEFKFYYEYYFLEKNQFPIEDCYVFSTRRNLSAVKLSSVFPVVWTSPEQMIEELYPDIPKETKQSRREKLPKYKNMFDLPGVVSSSPIGRKKRSRGGSEKDKKLFTERVKKVEEIDWESLNNPDKYRKFLNYLDNKQEKRGRKRKEAKIPEYLRVKKKRGKKPRATTLAGKEQNIQ